MLVFGSSSKQQAASSKQQAASSKQQAASSKQQAASGSPTEDTNETPASPNVTYFDLLSHILTYLKNFGSKYFVALLS